MSGGHAVGAQLDIFAPFKLVHVQTRLQESESKIKRLGSAPLNQYLGQLVKAIQTLTSPKVSTQSC